MSALLNQVLASARTLVNDDLGTQFTDPVLIPKIQEAHRELQEQLWLAGSPVVREQTDALNIALGTTALTNTSGLPSDLLCPIELFENDSGSSLGTPNWIPMTESFYIPIGITAGNKLTYWSWRKEILYLAPSTLNRSLVIRYRKTIPRPEQLTQEIGILFGESYLAARSAALVAGTLGNKEVYDVLTALAKENLSAVLQANRGSQRPIMSP